MITFRKGTKPGEVKIYLDGKHVGKVVNLRPGAQYFPKGKNEGGEVFPTFAECLASLK